MFQWAFQGHFWSASRRARANPAQSSQHCSRLGHLGRIGFGLMLSTGSSNLAGAEKKNAFRRTASGPLPVVSAYTEPVFKEVPLLCPLNRPLANLLIPGQ